jgi:hypothetical protein
MLNSNIANFLFLTFIGYFILFNPFHIYSQCCSGGSGSPIAGGASQGVLQDRQMEVGISYQYVGTDKFKTGNKDTARFLDAFYTHYLYQRIGYGLTKDLTVSFDIGYYLNKTEQKLDGIDTVTSSGIGDLIIFPRYVVFKTTAENKRTEITLGLGYKIPLGKYNDSTGYVEPFSGQTYYIINPPSVQPSSGSHDFIFYAFLFRGYTAQKFRLFANVTYIKKGWNPAGEKFGDYASIGLFAGKTFFQKFGVTFQLRGEWIDKMKVNNNILLYAYPNYDPEATGSKKIFITPQISYSHKKFTVFALSEIPIYQYVNKAQVVSQYQFTAGISYRFLTYKQGE